MKNRSEWIRWSVVILFAMAMAWVESSVVLYLRTMVDRLEPYQPNPLPIATGFAKAELIREVSTLVMLATVGWLAGRTWRSRAAYAVLAFGAWDIGYYIYLRPLTGWPHSLLDWDILFLIPLPWWGPVLAPVMIACLMICGGTLVAMNDRPDRPFWPRPSSLLLAALGGIVALYVFMADAIAVSGQGGKALREMLPTWFNWPLFLAATGLMATPVLELIWLQLGRPFAFTASRTQEGSSIAANPEAQS